MPIPVRSLAAVFIVVNTTLSAVAHASSARPHSPPRALDVVASGDVAGSVTDSTNGRPLPSVEVTVQRGTDVIANVTTDAFGRYIANEMARWDKVAREAGLKK